MEPARTERIHETIAREYRRLADTYDKRWSSYVVRSTRETAGRLPLGPSARVLDIGCGTGALLAELSTRYPGIQLWGVEPVAEMLAVARRKLPPSVELRQGWAEALPFGQERFDAIVSCNMFHYIAEPGTALREMARVLRPNGRIVVTDWCDDYLTCRVCGWWLRLFRRGYFKTYSQQTCARLLADHEYTAVEIDRYKIDWLWGLMTATATRSTT